jgi:hypothetical protein
MGLALAVNTDEITHPSGREAGSPAFAPKLVGISEQIMKVGDTKTNAVTSPAKQDKKETKDKKDKKKKESKVPAA